MFSSLEPFNNTAAPPPSDSTIAPLRQRHVEGGHTVFRHGQGSAASVRFVTAPHVCTAAETLNVGPGLSLNVKEVALFTSCLRVSQ